MRLVFFAFVCICLIQSARADDVVNIYSYRQNSLLEPLLEKFTAETGIKTNILFAKKGLLERIKFEGKNSPADILLTTDISKLQQAKDSNLSQQVDSDILHKNIPSQYRDYDNHWFALTTRARIIFASRQRVVQNDISYEQLALPKWRGRICTRSGQHVYSLGLIASMLAHKGESATRQWLIAVRDNLAKKPSGNDRAQVKAIFNGECDIALGNTYYMGKMQTNEKDVQQKKWADSVKLLFPNSNGRGTHVNISGMALAKYSPNKNNAIKLMEFLSMAPAQKIYSALNFEYPVKLGVAIDKRTNSWGELVADKLPLAEIAKYEKQASILVDEVGFDY